MINFTTGIQSHANICHNVKTLEITMLQMYLAPWQRAGLLILVLLLLVLLLVLLLLLLLLLQSAKPPNGQ